MKKRSDTSLQEKRSSLRRLLSLMLPEKKRLILCLICVIIANLAQLINPILCATVIDDFLREGLPQRGLYSILGLGILYLLLEILGSAATVCQSQSMAHLAQNVLHRLRIRVFDKIMRLKVKELDENGTGRYITRATNDVETVNEFYTDVFLNLFKDIFLLLGLLIFLLALDVRLALVSFTAVPLIFLLSFSLKKVIKKNFRNIKSQIGQINGFMAENVSGIRIVQAYGVQKEKAAEFSHLNRNIFKSNMIQVLLNSVLRPSMEMLTHLVIALLIAYSYNRVAGGALEVGLLYAFTTYVKKFFAPINDIAEKYTTIQSAFVSMDRIDEILESEGEPSQALTQPKKMEGKIEFRHVWFAYQEEQWILKDVSFVIAPGEKIAFVGSTGAGKTTIINLICRDYTVQKGQILLDDIPIEDWELSHLRRNIAKVRQDVFLFTGTVRDNIDMQAGLSDAVLEEKLIQAKAISLCRKEGLGTPITEQGLNFSAGERQLLSFARAIATDPAVLILDEATAHIDSRTEQMLNASLEAVSQGRSCIFIAHRLSTIRHCDTIFVLSHGQIAEQGDHEELLAQNGLYAKLIAAKKELTKILRRSHLRKDLL